MTMLLALAPNLATIAADGFRHFMVRASNEADQTLAVADQLTKVRTKRTASHLAMLLPPLLLGGCQTALMNPQGPVGAAQRLILINSMVVMLAVVIPVIIATFAFAWWFRASNTRAKYRPDWTYSGAIELVVWSIPILVIILLGGIAWIGSHQLDPYKPLESKNAPLQIQVVSLDWKWLFIYPEQGIATLNWLAIPVGTPVDFRLTSATVMNSFFIPQLGSQIYTMPGMVTRLHLQADKPGTFRGRSFQISGLGFSDMYFDTQAMPRQQFDDWVVRRGQPGGAEGIASLDLNSYRELAGKQGTSPVQSYGSVEAGLFEAALALAAPGSVGHGTGTLAQLPWNVAANMCTSGAPRP